MANKDFINQLASVYERAEPGVTPLGDQALPAVEQALQQGDVVIQTGTSNEAENATLVVPIMLRGDVMGALGFQEEQERQWTADEITLVEDVALQVALAIENVRLFEQTQTALEETGALYRASAELNMAETYEDILDTLRQHTLLGQGAQNVSLNLFDRPWAGDGMPDWIEVLARWGQLPAEDVSSRYPLSAFPSAAELLRPDTPTLIEDVAGDPRLDKQARALYLQHFGARSIIFTPLVVGGQWIGYINATYQQATTFSEPDVRRLTALSSQAAVAVQSLHQLRQIQAKARREALIREITSKVRASTDLETILQTTVAEVSRALGTSHGAIRLGIDESLKGNGRDESSGPDGPLSASEVELRKVHKQGQQPIEVSPEDGAGTGDSPGTIKSPSRPTGKGGLNE